MSSNIKNPFSGTTDGTAANAPNNPNPFATTAFPAAAAVAAEEEAPPLPHPQEIVSQVRALAQTQALQAQRIASLEHLTREQTQEIFKQAQQIDELKARNAELAAKREETAKQLLSLKQRNLEGASGMELMVRMKGLNEEGREEDLEGVMGCWGTTVNAVLNHQQGALWRLSRGMTQQNGALTVQQQQQMQQMQQMQAAYGPQYGQYGYGQYQGGGQGN